MAALGIAAAKGFSSLLYLGDQMDLFFDIVLSFPTVVFTCFLLLAMLYWMLTLVGLVGIEMLEFDLDGADSVSSLNVFSGLLFKLGLNGVPVTIVISMIALLGWMLCFLLVYFLFPWIPFTWLKVLLGVPVLCGVFYAAAMLTALLIKPLRPIFLASNQEVQQQILGQTAVVRTGQVTRTFGEACVADGGAGLIVKVRSYKDEVFRRGDKVVLLEHVAGENFYRVVAEADFNPQ